MLPEHFDHNHPLQEIEGEARLKSIYQDVLMDLEKEGQKPVRQFDAQRIIGNIWGNIQPIVEQRLSAMPAEAKRDKKAFIGILTGVIKEQLDAARLNREKTLEMQEEVNLLQAALNRLLVNKNG